MEKPSNPYNILLIITDQQSAKAMSHIGNLYVQTPAIDALAAQGVSFQNAYCCNPVCVPSRIGMFTGHYPHEAGIFLNSHKTTKELKQLPWMGKIFADAGYKTIYYGKSHLLVASCQKWIHGFSKFKITYGRNKDEKVAKYCTQTLAKEHKKPFLLVASLLNPHNVCELARKQKLPEATIGDPPAIDQCPPLPDNSNPQMHEPSAIEAAHQAIWKQYPTKNWTETDWRQYLWGYYRLVEHIDGVIGQILHALQTSQYAKNTIVVFTSDHGEGMAEHRWNQKQAFFEAVARIPFIIAHPESSQKGMKNSALLVNNGVDMIPTLADMAGILSKEVVAKYRLPGKSVRSGLFSETKAGPTDYVVSESEFGSFVDQNWTHADRAYGRMVRTAQFKYIIYSRGEIREALFNLKDDPGEMVNQVNNPDYCSEIARHREILKDWCIQTKDDFPYIG
jgi:choline-sulfatase